MFASIDPSIIFFYLRSSFDSVVSTIEEIPSNELVHKVIIGLKSDLCAYLERELPELEKEADEMIDEILPSRSEVIQKVVNDSVNRMIEEITREIESYIKSN